MAAPARDVVLTSTMELPQLLALLQQTLPGPPAAMAVVELQLVAMIPAAGPAVQQAVSPTAKLVKSVQPKTSLPRSREHAGIYT
mmetsp:Transcript_97118/g.172938  ORF Transcript_97118/g.172938 Transcript_97118/m.172938 type:complete len:84 (+) Transcript_97118:394-645(+)